MQLAAVRDCLRDIFRPSSTTVLHISFNAMFLPFFRIMVIHFMPFLCPQNCSVIQFRRTTQCNLTQCFKRYPYITYPMHVTNLSKCVLLRPPFALHTFATSRMFHTQIHSRFMRLLHVQYRLFVTFFHAAASRRCRRVLSYPYPFNVNHHHC